MAKFFANFPTNVTLRDIYDVINSFKLNSVTDGLLAVTNVELTEFSDSHPILLAFDYTSGDVGSVRNAVEYVSIGKMQECDPDTVDSENCFYMENLSEKHFFRIGLHPYDVLLEGLWVALLSHFGVKNYETSLTGSVLSVADSPWLTLPVDASVHDYLEKETTGSKGLAQLSHSFTISLYKKSMPWISRPMPFGLYCHSN